MTLRRRHIWVGGLALAVALGFGVARLRGSAPSTGSNAVTADAVAPATAAANAAVAARLDLAQTQGFVDARRGFIARPSVEIRAADGSLVWDFERFGFVDGPAPPTVDPSLWHPARLNNQIDQFKVADGIHPLRGFDLANMTLIDGKTGWIVVDT